MAKVFKVIGIIAGAVALIAGTIATFGIGAAAFAALAGSVAAIAGIVATVASLGAQLLTKPPPARGSVTQILIGPDAPSPYPMGEGYFAGALRHDTAYGATLNKVPNPYRWMVCVYSVVTAAALTPYVDLAAIDSYYSGFLYTDTQLGATPESAALSPHFAGPPGWDAASKLSGSPAIGWNLLFDKDGKRFASGVPVLGAYGQWAKVYDPRLDSTFPGGSGAHRIDDEDTFEWSENPALHAGTYAYGRFQNDSLPGGRRRVLGVGLPADGIDWANVAAWANVCDANSWRLFGVVYEPGDRWQNLSDIAQAGGAVPVLTADALTFHYAAPRVPLDTITEADLVEADCSVTAMTSCDVPNISAMRRLSWPSK